MADKSRSLDKTSNRAEINAFLEQVSRSKPPVSGSRPGRLLFAIDATASRQPTWDKATDTQAQMFEAAGRLGGLEVQLAYYRGYHEFHASQWVSSASRLAAQMTTVQCRGGLTQVERLLQHAINETRRQTLSAAVFVGDCMEENPDRVCDRAGELGLLGTPVFLFQEGRDPVAEKTFREVARLTRGAWCPFDSNSAEQLRELLAAVAVFATGGRQALEHLGKRSGTLVKRLTQQLSGP
jgi:hypothetical protein